MKRVDFYSLPRAVQEHVVDSLAGRLVPVPILARYGARPKARSWWAVSAVAALALLLLCVLGFGDARRVLSLHPLPLALLYVVLVGAFAIGLLNAAAYGTKIRALPFAPGIYLFPANVIDAREPTLRVFPLEQLTAAAAGPGASVVLSFGSETFNLPLADAARVSEALARIETERARAATEMDPKARFELDALEPPSVMSPLAPQHQIVSAAPSWARLRWVIAAAAGVLFGGAIYQVRNNASDNRMLANAQAKDDVASYSAYVARGKRHKDMVADVLLPRAELRVAVADGSVEAIDAFIAAHPKTGIASEVEAARRNALVAEFGRARDEGSLAALLDFAARHPNHGMGPAFDQARTALFDKVLTRYRTRMAEGEEATVDLVRALLTYSKKVGATKTAAGHRGPTAQIRFARLESVSLNRADSAVSKNPSFNGAPSYPSRYFNAKRLAPHEERLAADLQKQLQSVFPKEVLVLESGPAIEWPEDALPEVKTPTLVVSYRIEWSGGAFAKRKPRGVFVGLFVFFKSVFLIPGQDALLTAKFTAAENVPHEVIEAHSENKAPGSMEGAAYEAMTSDAFAQFDQRYLAKWFASAAKKKR